MHVYMIVVSEYYSRAEEQCRTSSSESRALEGSLSIWKKILTCLLAQSHQHMLLLLVVST